ncbi:hypothetical protein QIA27_05010 (plasmid) [Borreliella tanukii]|uniref:hypothetical protein n=1 Tax=Borreliella tanukii TaxID=56146 RepID=UPI003AEF8CA1
MFKFAKSFQEKSTAKMSALKAARKAIQELIVSDKMNKKKTRSKAALVGAKINLIELHAPT